MDKHFPYDMKLLMNQDTVKAAFVSDITSKLPNDCKNCGGFGVLVVFIATEGPYNTPAAPYRGDNKTSHWHDNKWWVGSSYSFPCPDCKGFGQIEVKQTKQVPVQHEIQELTKELSV